MIWSDHDMNGWGYAGMAIGMVLFWALIVIGIVVLIRFATGADQARIVTAHPHYSESPEQVLATRFARGEIDADEYQQRLAVLRAGARK